MQGSMLLSPQHRSWHCGAMFANDLAVSSFNLYQACCPSLTLLLVLDFFNWKLDAKLEAGCCKRKQQLLTSYFCSRIPLDAIEISQAFLSKQILWMAATQYYIWACAHLPRKKTDVSCNGWEHWELELNWIWPEWMVGRSSPL